VEYIDDGTFIFCPFVTLAYLIQNPAQWFFGHIPFSTARSSLCSAGKGYGSQWVAVQHYYYEVVVMDCHYHYYYCSTAVVHVLPPIA
jgi:hypothetical protein